ncbi:MAG: prephenate dehydratase domain-containing protein [Oscillospiraceae bacterium]|nr:prephenate dehydratase domain-containing protein [Oscillospiraceae bacterium]
MELNDLRDQIDQIDEEILNRFQKRMKLCQQVAEYKRKNSLSVYQGGREQEVIEKVKQKSEEQYKTCTSVLFKNIMDISKSLQQYELNKTSTIAFDKLGFSNECRIGCQGMKGSNSEEAAHKIFGSHSNITFYREFEDVFRAVEEGKADFGVIPVQNSSTGSISQTYDLMKRYNVYINKMVRISIRHCLAANTDNINDINEVYSHPQALSQCTEYLKQNRLTPVNYANTATAAKFAANSEKKIGVICSEKCAQLYKLHILGTDISDEEMNFTRFICISKQCMIADDADTISVLMNLSNQEGSLYRMLTKFRVAGLNLSKIESRPLHKGNFDVTFYLDFNGNIKDDRVSALITSLSNELDDFKFLGNYSELV